MSPKIWAIVTYHHGSDREEAAEAWKEDHVCAMGWSWVGDLRKIRTFEQLSEKMGPRAGRGLSSLWAFKNDIKRGDLILAYATRNTIAYVGKVTGPYTFEKKNRVGKDSDHGGFEYQHQRRVNWWLKPHYFNRKKLPMEAVEQIGIHGCIIKDVDPGSIKFEGFEDFLKRNAESLTDSSLEINEDTIKAGIRKYLRNYIDELEKGLKIVYAERGIHDQKRPDFKARDARGSLVLVECKGLANEDAVEQVKEYLKKSKKEKTRAILVAFRITPKCRALAKKHNIELFECDLNFNKI